MLLGATQGLWHVECNRMHVCLVTLKSHLGVAMGDQRQTEQVYGGQRMLLRPFYSGLRAGNAGNLQPRLPCAPLCESNTRTS